MPDEQAREARAISPAREQERAAITLAEQRGREAAELAGRLDDHSEHLRVLDGSVERSAKELHEVREGLRRLTTAFEQGIAIAAARAQDAKEAAEKQVSTRTFV